MTSDTPEPTGVPSGRANPHGIVLLMASPKADRPWENESPMSAAISERRPATEENSGVIERVTFHNDETLLVQG
jgi:hypothetical protein